jgi:formylglycine-generating enzyme required for sulfatase activity/energy-coupling factor transporter ATP-binding protein EcfA2
MPTLFISYKRGTAAVAPLMDKLRAAAYRLWFDRDEIHLGDPDWQARIDQGISLSDGVILNITPAACESEPVRYEVRKAQALGKPIFPIILERIADYDAAIAALGLAAKTHIEDFTDVTRWDEQTERLLRDLIKQGLRVTRHDRRKERDPDNPAYVLHQQYLKRLVERIGTLNLAQITPEGASGIDLEAVYVDSPTPYSISVEVKDWQVIDWWISEGQQRKLIALYYDEPKPDEPRLKSAGLGYETAPFETLLSAIDTEIADYRRDNPDKKPDEILSLLNRWNNGIKRNWINLHLSHLAAARDRLVVLGAPGSGKSTFVKFLALCLAGAASDGWARAAKVELLDNWAHGALTPIYIELRRFVASAQFPKSMSEGANADHLWAYICADVLGADLQGYAPDLQYDLEHGHALLILDGLDEVPYPEGQLKARQAQIIALAQSINTRYARSRVLVASRPYAYEGWKLPGFEAVTITAFEDEHRTRLAERLYVAAGANAKRAREQAGALNAQLRRIDPELKDRPLFVTLMAAIYLKSSGQGLPTRRSALCRESILLLLDRWTARKAGMRSLLDILGDHTLADLLARLAALAFEVHSNYGHQPGTPEIDEALLYKHLKALGRSTAAELIPYLSENAGVLVSPGQDEDKDVFHFAHRPFQEYLAAVYIVSECSKADSFALMRTLICDKPQQWRVPCALAGDVLADTERRSELWNLIGDLTDDALTPQSPPSALHSVVPNAALGEGLGVRADDPRWWGVWLSAVIIEEQTLHEQTTLRRGERAIRDGLVDWLVRLVETAQALRPPERAQCGRALGLLGDTRKGVGLRADGLPDITWADEIQPGSYSIGETEQGNNPPREIQIKHPYRVSKFLVTQAQYLAFQNDKSERGYTCADWWQGLAADEDDEQAAEPRFRYDNHPMEQVNWYQAVAFCRWLTYRLRGTVVGTAFLPSVSADGKNAVRTGIVIGENAIIRLPHEYEWEVAARGDDGHTYSYRGDFEPAKANTRETNIGQTSAVGIFPEDRSPCGALDMTGNVGEWCVNRRNDQDTDDLSGTDTRALRGGSWSNYPDFARAAYRRSGHPLLRNYDLGFRVALVVPHLKDR